MINSSDVVKHLKTYLPSITDLFTATATVISASSNGSVLSVEVAGHGYTEGQKLVLAEGKTENELATATLTANDTAVEFTTVFDHDLIKPRLPLDDQFLTLGGFGNVWDGDHQILEIKNRRTLEVALPSGETEAPAIDGNQYLSENIVAGVYPVGSVVDADNFTVDLSGLPDMPTGQVDSLGIISGFRIAGAADFERAKATYAEQQPGEPYLYVIMDDVDISKDRHTTNDSIAGFTDQDMNLLRILQNFSTTVFIPTTGDLSGVDAHDLAYKELYISLLATLYGLKDEGNSAIQYKAVTAGHGPGEYNTAYYAHVYDWQLPGAITFEDGFMDRKDVAFRDIEATFKLFNDSEAEMTVNIDLDDEPLP
jgi:hypothetical protein